jgi:putative transposase
MVMSGSAMISPLAVVERIAGLTENLTPKVPLPVGGMITMDGHEYAVVGRVGQRWQLLSFENEHRLIDDAALYEKMSCGAAHAHADRTTSKRNPLTPLLVGERAAAKNAMKFAFVSACRGLPRSRPALRGRIRDVADALGIDAPAFTSVLGWIDLYEAHPEVGTASLSDRDDCKGRRGSRLPEWQEEGIAAGLQRYLTPGETMATAYSAVTAAVAAYDKQQGCYLDRFKLKPHQLDQKGRLLPPSLRTFERRCRAVDPIERDLRQKGLSYVKQRYPTWQTRGRPERPYAEVECDHCTLDIQIIDQSGMIFGRPDLIIFLDRATKMILGYSIGFEAPSYASFMRGLQSVYFAKDLTRFPAVKNPWPCVGSIETLFVDNAFHFIGENIQAAGLQLGFNTTILLPREPWLKGSIERFFGTLNTGLVHRLPGTTGSNVIKRREVDIPSLPTLTMEAFEALLVYWICDVYHAQPHRGAGFIPGVPDVPLRLWAEKLDAHLAPQPPSTDLFIALAGERETRVIGRQGIEWDRIKYQSPDLMAVKSHPDHKANKGSATRYQVVRDPFDLGSISLINHHTNEVVRVPAAHAYSSYAQGTTAYQHQVCLKRARELVGSSVDIEALQHARELLGAAIHSIVEQDSFKKTHRKLARFMNENVRRSELSSPLVFAPPSSAASGFQSFPPQELMREPASWDSQGRERSRADDSQTSGFLSTPDDDDDFAELLKSRKLGGGYDS